MEWLSIIGLLFADFAKERMKMAGKHTADIGFEQKIWDADIGVEAK